MIDLRQIGQEVHELLSDIKRRKQTSRDFYFLDIDEKLSLILNNLL